MKLFCAASVGLGISSYFGTTRGDGSHKCDTNALFALSPWVLSFLSDAGDVFDVSTAPRMLEIEKEFFLGENVLLLLSDLPGASDMGDDRFDIFRSLVCCID